MRWYLKVPRHVIIFVVARWPNKTQLLFASRLLKLSDACSFGKHALSRSGLRSQKAQQGVGCFVHMLMGNRSFDLQLADRRVHSLLARIVGSFSEMPLQAPRRLKLCQASTE
mmetsp:Transcript_1263/g.3315  ORF Transcript_1263/g.3315 Transcript_1263/m.3315 type:complete len:112 (+) Transcript_1263:272-607(+)